MSYFCSMDKRSVKILVVDDEEAIREGLCEYLRLEGYRADSASGAEEAMRMGPGNYSLLLLDIMMEGIDGFELARRIRGDAATASLPIIFLTARDTDDDMVAGLRIGADDYIPKPFSMKNVMARIEAVLRRSGAAGAPESGVVCDRTTLLPRRRPRDQTAPQGIRDSRPAPGQSRQDFYPPGTHGPHLARERGCHGPFRRRPHHAPALQNRSSRQEHRGPLRLWLWLAVTFHSASFPSR